MEDGSAAGSRGDVVRLVRTALAENAGPWTEAALARRAGTDLARVRRALDVLEAEGALRRVDEASVERAAAEAGSALPPAAALMEARLRLEPELAALAALRATPREIRLMRRFASREMACTAVEEQETWGAAVHRLIASAARNPSLLAAFDAVDAGRGQAEWRRMTAHFDWSDCGGVLGGCDHGGVVDAVASGDPETAALVMRAHLLEVAARVEKAEAARRAAEDAPLPGRAGRR